MKKEKLETIKFVKEILKAERFILTGGTVLALNGLKQGNDDIDVVLLNATEQTLETVKNLQKTNSAKTKQKYDVTFGLVGIFEKDGLKFDVFNLKEFKDLTLNYEGIEIATIGHIIEEKKNLNRPKDWFQLRLLSRVFLKGEEFEKWLNEQGK